MLAARAFTRWRGWRGVEHQIELTAESLWSEVAGRLRGALNDTTYGTWFGEAHGLELDDERFVLAVPNDFTRDWIEGHFIGLIGAAIRDVTGRERPIELRVADRPLVEGRPGARPDGARVVPGDRASPPRPPGERRLQLEVHLRFLRHRLVEPLRPRGRTRRRRSAGTGL